MFKIIAIALVGFGIYIGINYTDEINSVVESDGFEQVVETVTDLMDNKDKIVEVLEEIQD